MSIFVFLFMVLMHIIEDFHIQGILADMKQKHWWYDELAKVSAIQSDKDMSEIMDKYKWDYTEVLVLHGFEWSMFIHIPLMVWYGWTLGIPFETDVVWTFISSIAVNTLIHAYVDDLKANRLKINLVQDQLFHMMQMVVTFAVFWGVLG